MTGSKGGCFVEEEKLGIVARGHDRAPAVLKLQQADDPALPLKLALDLAAIVVEATAVAH